MDFLLVHNHVLKSMILDLFEIKSDTIIFEAVVTYIYIIVSIHFLACLVHNT